MICNGPSEKFWKNANICIYCSLVMKKVTITWSYDIENMSIEWRQSYSSVLLIKAHSLTYIQFELKCTITQWRYSRKFRCSIFLILLLWSVSHILCNTTQPLVLRNFQVHQSWHTTVHDKSWYATWQWQSFQEKY